MQQNENTFLIITGVPFAMKKTRESCHIILLRYAYRVQESAELYAKRWLGHQMYIYFKNRKHSEAIKMN